VGKLWGGRVGRGEVELSEFRALYSKEKGENFNTSSSQAGARGELDTILYAKEGERGSIEKKKVETSNHVEGGEGIDEVLETCDGGGRKKKKGGKGVFPSCSLRREKKGIT